MRWRGVEPWDLQDDGGDGLEEERYTHHLASLAAYEWLEGQSARVVKSRTILAVRCPDRGCLLSEVYRFPLSAGGERYLSRCMTARQTRAEILNWAFSDDWNGPTVWYPVGCKHGSGKLERVWLLDLIGLCEGWHHAMETVEQSRAGVPESELRGIARRVFHPKPELWSARSVGDGG